MTRLSPAVEAIRDAVAVGETVPYEELMQIAISTIDPAKAVRNYEYYAQYRKAGSARQGDSESLSLSAKQAHGARRMARDYLFHEKRRGRLRFDDQPGGERLVTRVK